MSTARLRLQYRRYRLPFRAPVRTAHGVWTHREGLWVRIEDSAGRAGWGECAPLPGWTTETVDAAEAALGELGEWAEEAALDRLPAGLACLRGAVAAAREEEIVQQLHENPLPKKPPPQNQKPPNACQFPPPPVKDRPADPSSGPLCLDLSFSCLMIRTFRKGRYFFPLRTVPPFGTRWRPDDVTEIRNDPRLTSPN
jgi:hypothetical protein